MTMIAPYTDEVGLRMSPTIDHGEAGKRKHVPVKGLANTGLTFLSSSAFIQSNSETVMNIQRTAGSIQAASHVLSNFANFLERLKNVIVFKQIVLIVLAPVHIYKMIKNAGDLPKSSDEKRVDIALNMVEGVRTLSETAGAFVVGLAEIKAIPTPNVAWLGPFASVMALFSIVSMVKNYRTIKHMNRLMNEIVQIQSANNVNGKLNQTGYRLVLSLLEKKHHEDADFIKDTFHVTDEKFAEALLKREDEAMLDDPNGQSAVLDQTINALKGRISSNIKSAKVSLLAAGINILGTIALLWCPILAIGWSFVGVGIVCDFGRMIYDAKASKAFTTALNIKTTWLENLAS